MERRLKAPPVYPGFKSRTAALGRFPAVTTFIATVFYAWPPAWIRQTLSVASALEISTSAFMYENKYAAKSAGQPAGLSRRCFRLLAHVLLGVFRPRLHIVDDQPDFLALDANCYTVVASKPEQIVSVNGETIATFISIEAIHIRHFVRGAGDRRREWWTVSLKIARRPAIVLGKSQDSMEASIAAAHLSRLIERPVVAM